VDNDGSYDAEGETYLFDTPDDWEIGSTHTVQLRVTDNGSWAGPDGGGSKSAETTVTILVVPNQPPDCTGAYADPDCLWPPNHKFVDVAIMGVTDPDEEDTVSINIDAITSDEPTASDAGSGGAKHAPDASGVGTDTASVRAERSGNGDGRVYVIHFTASDDSEAQCQGSVMVKVTHDQSSDDCPAIDSGQEYDATGLN
jgi:hypothetical protein